MIRWIGWDVELERTEHDEEVIYWEDDDEDGEIEEEELKTKNVTIKPLDKVPIDGPSRSLKYETRAYKMDRYGLTKDGHAINVDSYCTLLTDIQDTYVTLHQDRDD